jgi:hypothetical protein
MNLTQQEWDALMASYPPGTPVSGVVVRCKIFGVFVRLDDLPDVPALLEVIHFRQVEAEPTRCIEYPVDYPTVNSRLEARILGWCLFPNNDVRLTQLSHLDWYRRP